MSQITSDPNSINNYTAPRQNPANTSTAVSAHDTKFYTTR